MIYFSELKGKKIYTEDNIFVGLLEDLIFLATEKPIITKIVVRSVFKEKLIIPVAYIQKINKSIDLSKDYLATDLEENELFVLRNLLDKQIIDLKGHKVVRVNDVAIQEKDGLYVAGVDIGFLGVVRWLGIENFINNILKIFNYQITSRFLSWADIQPLELVRGEVRLKKKEEKLQSVRPEDLADYLESTNVVSARKFLRILDDKKAAEVISSLNVNYQTAFFKHFKPERAAKFITLIEPDDAIDVLLTLSLKKREQILNLLPSAKKHELFHLLNLAKNPIGNLATTQFFVMRSDETVRSAINKIKTTTQNFSFLNYVYVVNESNQLVGVFNLHELLLHDFSESVYKFMKQSVIVAHLTTPKDLVIKRMLKYSLDAVPIIDDQKHIIGVISFDDMSEFLTSRVS